MPSDLGFTRIPYLTFAGADTPTNTGCVVRPPGQVHRGLPGGVAPANDGHVVAFAQLGFERGGGVVDPTALELGDIGQGKAAVARTRGDDDSVRAHLGAVV